MPGPRLGLQLDTISPAPLRPDVRRSFNMAPDPEYTGSVMLMILGDDLDPDEVSDRLGLAPSQAWRKGERHSFAKPDGSKLEFMSKHRGGGWKRFIGAGQEKLPLEAQLEFWHRKLRSRIAALSSFRSKGWDCVLDLFVTTDETASIIFSADLQSQISELGVELRISIWAVRGRLKPATSGRIKTSQFEEKIIGRRSHKTRTLADESTQIEPATVHINSA